MPDEMVVYWDSDLFISRIQRTEHRIAVLEQITKAAERGEVRIVTSIFAKAETAYLKHPTLLPEEQEARIISFFENPYITVVPFDDFVCDKTRHLVRQFREARLPPSDAIHVATAIVRRVPLLQAYNSHLLNLDGKIPGLRIQKPTYAGDIPLPLETDDE